MANGQLGAVVRQIHRLFGEGTVCGLSEGQLLTRFVEKKDEAAFEALVSRFGPMVLGVCRQILDDPHAADDAFQATFLVLVKRAGSIRDRDLLGNWLYGVTLKVAKRARADLAKRKTREKEGAEVRSETIGDRPAFNDPDLGPILHEELARLPGKYRDPIVFCCLDGRTCEQAAVLLNWPVGTVKGRLSRGKDLLRDRLGRRGVTASTGLIAATLSKSVEASIPPLLFAQTVKAAMGLAAGGAVAAGLASATAVALSEGVVTSMIFSKGKILAMTIALIGTLTTGVGVMATQGLGPGQDTEKSVPKGTADGPIGKPSQKITVESTTRTSDAVAHDNLSKSSAYIDLATKIAQSEPALGALPPTEKLNENRIAAAMQFLDATAATYEKGTITADRFVWACKNLMEARYDAATDPSDRIKALEDYVRSLRWMVKNEIAKVRVGIGDSSNIAEAASNLANAEVELAKLRSGAAKTVVAAQPGGLVQEDEEDLAHDEAIRKKLSMPIAMPFPNETPLSQVIKYIKDSTTDPGMEQGLPIYVDPQGLQEAEKTMDSPITFSMDQVRLKTSLRLILKQLEMGYYIREGMVIITYLRAEDYLDAVYPNRAKPGAIGGMMGGGMGGMSGGGMMGGGGLGGGGGGFSGGAGNPPATPKGGGGKP